MKPLMRKKNMDTNVNTITNIDTNMNINPSITEVHYDAFISYRHSELDKFVAEELHKQLETFKVPKKIAKKIGKKRINRIFRDKDELPITSNLADPIINALRTSEFLIVICSPRLKESLWCKREIENFIAMHGQERVLAVLIEGEPGESFPEELLFREKAVTLENGEVRTIKEAVEPLAADVRGKSKKEIKKQIKTEILRLLAPILNCNYDDLKQRHKERKTQRILAAAALICMICLSFGSISTVMALKIQEQKEQLDTQYWETLKTNAKMASENALELLEKGDRIGAITLARELLPDSLTDTEKPYTPEAYYALTQSLYPYAIGDVLCPVYQIKENAEINTIKLSPDEDKLLTLTKYNQLTVWDMANKIKCIDVNLKEYFSQNFYDYQLTFLGSKKVAVLVYDKIAIFDLEGNETGEVSTLIPCDKNQYFHTIKSDAEGKYVSIISNSCIQVYEVESQKVVYTYVASEEEKLETDNVKITSDNQLIYIKENADENIETSNIIFVNLENQSITHEYETKVGEIEALDISSDSFVVVSGKILDDSESILSTDAISVIYSFDLNTYSEKCWEYEVEEYVTEVVAPAIDHNYVLFKSYGKVTALEAKTGILQNVYAFASDIIEIFQVQTKDAYVLYTRGGGYANLLPNLDLCVSIEGTFISGSDNVKEMVWGNTFRAALPYSSKEVIVYDFYENTEKESVITLDNYISAVCANENSPHSVIFTYNDVVIIENETGEITGELPADMRAVDMKVLDNQEIEIVNGDTVYFYDEKGNLLRTVLMESDYLITESISVDGKYVYGTEHNSLSAYECATGKQVASLSKEKVNFQSGDEFVFSNTCDKCVVLSVTQQQCNVYETTKNTLIGQIDIDATYVADMFFSEDDNYIYIVYEDGKVERYHCDTMELTDTIEELDYVTSEIYEKEIAGEKKYYFASSYGAYVLCEIDGQLKVEQFVKDLGVVFSGQNKYWIVEDKKITSFPIYTYEEMLGKADQICYDNSLWNN